jgi:hypothetical protein
MNLSQKWGIREEKKKKWPKKRLESKKMVYIYSCNPKF